MGIAYSDAVLLDFSGTSPSSATTTAGSSSIDISTYNSGVIYGIIQGATGGNLDVYLQTSFDGSTWIDFVHFTQKAAAAAAVGYVIPFQCGLSLSATPVTVNTASGTPVLANSNAIPGALGRYLRRVDVAGASTSAGASQTIQVYLRTI